MAHAASVQFGGNPQGLNIETIRLHWSRQYPGDYTFRFRVPTEPWLTVTGEHPVVDGRYPVTVTCADPGFIGCGLGVDARGTFTLTGLTRPRRKAAVLHFSPRHGAPGTWVHVTGWAPLTAVSRQPSAYQLTVNGAFPPSLDVRHLTQAPNGALFGAFRVPTAAILGKPLRPGKIFVNLVYQSGQVPLTFAATPFRMQRPRTWASLGRFRPKQVADNAAAGSFGIQFGIAGSSMAGIGAPISRDTGEMVVSSVPGTLWIERSAAWTPVLTAPLASLAQTMGYPIASDATQSPIVTSATLLPSYPESLFVAVEANSTAKSRWFPPEFNIACYSTNDGTTWQAVPIPHGYTAGDFGGYQTEGSTLAAYFTAGKRWTLEVTANGGATWARESTYMRPASGPPLRFGAMQNGRVPGFVNEQPILRENRRGGWVTAAEVNNQEGVVTLATLSATRTLLIRPGSPYPVEVSVNDGKDWTYVQLPALPGLDQPRDSQIVGMMANGDLVADTVPLASDTPEWFILKPGADAWEHVPASRAPATRVSATINGASIEWLVSAGTSTVPPTVVSISQQRL